jgi:hypothetical protein
MNIEYQVNVSKNDLILYSRKKKHEYTHSTAFVPI